MIKKLIIRRVQIVFLLVFFFALFIICKLFYIQFIQGEKFRKKAKKMQISYRIIHPTRGNIYTKQGDLLATSLPYYRVALDPCIASAATFRQGIDSLANQLANFYQDYKAAYYKNRIVSARNKKKQYIIINNKQVSYQHKKKMSKWPIFREGRWKGGIIFEKQEKRFNPFGPLALRTIGFVNNNDYGVGLEYSFHSTLQGIPGKGLFQKTAAGYWKMRYNGSLIKPQHGHDIITTIDINLQDVVHHTLLQALQLSDADYGCAIVMHVASGEIRAIVNLSRMQKGKYQEYYNYALGSQGTVEPGSTIKAASMMALLEEESNLHMKDSIDTGKGVYQFYDRIMRDVKKDGFGKITLQDVIAYSSNIGIAKLVDSIFISKPYKFLNYLNKFGFSKPVGMPIIGEGKPSIQHPKSSSWSQVTLPWMSMGYALKVTPLHILSFYNAIANDGKWIQPTLVTHTQQAPYTRQAFQSTKVIRRICSDKTLKQIKVMLESVVQYGTARKLYNSTYPIAGKSGTAQRLINGRYSKSWYTSFVGYFPAHTPRYSCIVCIDNPKGTYRYGANMAAPVLKKIADKIAIMDVTLGKKSMIHSPTKMVSFPYIKIGYKKDLLKLCRILNIPTKNIPNTSWIRTSIKNDTIVWKPYQLCNEKKMPNVYGMTLKDALYLLENRRLKVIAKGRGRVNTQSYIPGNPIKSGQTIILTLK